ncbi:hypothetical protein P872_11420 [Rhodonellum psychrophilum GCM71 = DSM 17998]|uniref:Cytochrome c domain-containing protein n=2 Tax=Rhodonellum TaxID=336827 RepID=U5BWR8_9BACT|nr:MULTISPECIES: c-type cytochrome [Rhodonellum]ERM81061.1 hypothetical protein P872_11420 [Rhodonellum psychrophilum GCM71 = DSM 17998]MDO9552100.1 c-type cytochrome [Rhodonellum sp.]SDZ57233.1 Cytochrome c [Rhodonellum ikkaensis]
MKKPLKIIAYSATAIVILIIGSVAYLSIALPNVGPPPEDLKVENSPEKIAHGNYLAHHVMLCMDCHSVRDYSLFTGPLKPGTEATGGEIFDQSMGFPGVFISPNITPFGIGEWTDGELFRLITTGVKRDGNPIFPVMPYPNFGKMDAEDIEAVIAYIRTLEPVETNHAKSKPDFPFKLIMRTLPKKAALVKKPSPVDQIAYGAYMINASGCGECHTKFEKGAFTGEYLAGGRSFQFPDGSLLTSPNLTPDETGLANWTLEMFVQKFKMYGNGYVSEKINPGDFQTIMPWMMYAGLKESDLEAMYAYLRSLDPVKNPVEKFKPASPTFNSASLKK